MNNHLKKLCCACGFSLLLTVGASLVAEEDDPVTFRFEAGLSNGSMHHARDKNCTDFSPWGGTPLSKETLLEGVPPVSTYGAALKRLPTGATDQAIAFEGTGKLNASKGAFSLWVTGKNWDTSNAAHETLLTIEGEDQTISLERSKPNMLSLVSSKGFFVDVPFKISLVSRHFIVVNYGSGNVAIFLDMLPVGSGPSFVMLKTIKRIVLGQLGQGTGTNRYLEYFYTYKRPMTPGEITATYFEQGDFALERLVTIPRRTKPITVDGQMDEEAWKDAAVLSGMTHINQNDSYSVYWSEGKLSEVEDQVYLTYDDDYLYVGYYNPAPKRIRSDAAMVVAMLQTSKTKHDVDVDSDDSFFVRVRNPYPIGDEYRLFVNYADCHYDWTRAMADELVEPVPGTKLKGININWDPDWKTKSKLDTMGWHLEEAIPLKAFDVPPAKPGTEWRVNFTRIWKHTLTGFTAWCAGMRDPMNGNLISGAGLGRMRFGTSDDVIVRLLGTGEINGGMMDVQLELVNLGDKAQTIVIEVSTNSGERGEKKEIPLAAKERKLYRYQGRIADFSTGLITIKVLNSDSKEIFLHQLPVVRSDKIDIYQFNYPSSALVKYEVSCLSLSKFKPEDLLLDISSRDTSGREYFSQTIMGLPNYAKSLEIPVQSWPKGNYKVNFTFRAGGQVLDTVAMDYTRKELPEWYGNTIGMDGDHPSFPWNDMGISGEQVYVSSGPLKKEVRMVDFGQSVFPERIMTQGRQLLRAPIRLIGETGEGGAFNSVGAKAESVWTKKASVRVEGRRSATVGDMKLSNEFWMEYDGFCWMKMILEPLKKKGTLKSLILEIPFTKEFSDVMNCNDYSIAKNDVIPPEGVTHPATLPIWVGNAVGGLQFFVDTTGPWSIADAGTAIKLENGPEGATMKVTMVDVPMTIENLHAIEVGFTVTPVKTTFHREIKQISEGLTTKWNYWWFPTGAESSDWMPAHYGWEGWAGSSLRFDTNPPGWCIGGPYLAANFIPTHSSDKPAMETVWEFADEWVVNPSYRFRQGVVKPTSPDLMKVSYHAKSYRDWLVWKYYQLFQKNGYRCMYNDCGHIGPSANPYASAGYVKKDGSRVTNEGILAIRELHKRFYNFMAHTYPEAPKMVFHSSGMPNVSYEAFGTRFWTDENLGSRLNEQQPTYRGLITPAKFRAEYLGRNFGNFSGFIGQGRISADRCFKYGVDALWDQIKGLCLLHDMEKGEEGWHIAYAFNYNKGWSIGKALIERDEKAFRRHNVYSLDYDFFGYWDQKVVKLPNKDTYVSYYVRKNTKPNPQDLDDSSHPEVVFIVCNDSGFKGEMKLDVDWKALGFDPAKSFRAENVVHRIGLRIDEQKVDTEKVFLVKKPNETAKVVKGKLVFPMTEWNYRMIAVEQP